MNTNLNADDLIDQAVSTLESATTLFEQHRDAEGMCALALAQFTATLAQVALLKQLLEGPAPTFNGKLRSV